MAAGGGDPPAVKYLLGGQDWGRGLPTKMAIIIKLSFFYLFFFIFSYFKSINQELVELRGGRGWGGLGISAIFFSLLDNIKFTEEEIKDGGRGGDGGMMED